MIHGWSKLTFEMFRLAFSNSGVTSFKSYKHQQRSTMNGHGSCARKHLALFTSLWPHEISNNFQSQWEMSKWIRSKNRWREGDVLWVGAAGAHLARWHLHGSTECANGLIGAEQHRAAESDKSVAQQRRKKKNKCQNTLPPERTQPQNLCASDFSSRWVTCMAHKITISAWNWFFWTPYFLTFIILTNHCQVGDPF